MVGRWKSKLTRAVGHAGAMAGGGDDARGQGTLVHGEVRRRRALHAGEPGVLGQGRGGDQHRPHPGGADRGDARQRRRARLRARRATWRSSPGSARARGCALPPELRPAGGRRRSRPTTSRSTRSNRQIGAVLPRQTMKDASGASQMDPKTQVTQPARRHRCSTRRSTRWRRTSPGAAARARRRQRPDADQRRGRRRRQPARPSGAGGGAGRARGRQCAERGAGGGGRHPRAASAARRARAAPGADRRASPPPGSTDAPSTRTFDTRPGAARRTPQRCSSADRPDAQAEAMLAGLKARGAQVGVPALPAEPARPSDRRRGAGRDRRPRWPGAR